VPSGFSIETVEVRDTLDRPRLTHWPAVPVNVYRARGPGTVSVDVTNEPSTVIDPMTSAFVQRKRDVAG
jgi:hypothetical protein